MGLMGRAQVAPAHTATRHKHRTRGSKERVILVCSVVGSRLYMRETTRNYPPLSAELWDRKAWLEMGCGY